MDWLSNIREMQVDVSSYCNAACGTCIRFDSGSSNKLHSAIELRHFDMDVWTRLVTHDIKNMNLDYIMLNGNWGDAGMHPQLLDMVSIALEENKSIFVKISTNGSLRTAKWWKQLAQIMGDRGAVVFCIEGVDQETHSRYRRKTSYDKIITNLKAFNDAGGNSIWTMTAFDHNIHQIDQSMETAKQIGCMEFETRRSHEDIVIMDTHTVTTNHVTADHIVRKQFKKLKSQPDPDIWPQLKSQCNFYNSNSIQIDPHGTVWPCCYISQFRYGVDDNGKILDDVELSDTVATLNKQFSLSKRSLSDILQDQWYTKYLPKVVNDAKWHVCRSNCKVKKV